MSTTSSFSLPEDVTFNFVVKKEPLDDFGFPNTFPKVKRFVAKVNFWTPMTAEVLHRLSAIIKCFTDLEIAKIIINSDHCWRSHGFNEIVKFHEWLRDTNFSVPVNVNVSENVDISYLSENPQSMYDKLKSFGYKDDGSMNLCNTGFVIEKEYGNVKLIHHISHYDSFVCRLKVCKLFFFHSSTPSTSASTPPHPSPSTATMTTNPQLKNHLIRELIDTTRLKSDGDATVPLALTGKEPFSVFTYLIKARAHAHSLRGDIVIKCSSPNTSLLVPLGLKTEASRCLVFRFVRDLIVDSPLPKGLHFEKITNLTVRRYAKPLTSVRIPWTDIEILKVSDIPDTSSGSFFKDYINTSLPNLRKLEIGLTLKRCIKLMRMNPPVPLPEDVTFLINVRKDPTDFGFANTYPSVKHFEATVQVWTDLTAELLEPLSTIIKCFTGIETAKLVLSHDHHSGRKEFEKVCNFHEWLRNTKFSVPVEIEFTEKFDLAYNFDVTSLYTQLKSIGFEEDDFVFHLIVKKDLGNTKLVHRIEHYDSFSD
uniref:F-box domain-containing protein n=1 Tax=Panagrellus redivivus TaxID=6233 RepID=A0A7E4V4M1_PANRE